MKESLEDLCKKWSLEDLEHMLWVWMKTPGRQRYIAPYTLIGEKLDRFEETLRWENEILNNENDTM